METDRLDPRDLRKALGQFSTGVTVVTTSPPTAAASA
jgi:flavin reductase (DIM6/NTAB) family NADH-FMN oxidoreductase RutF